MAYIRLKLAGFRWYGGCALAGIILLVCVLQFTGLCIVETPMNAEFFRQRKAVYPAVVDICLSGTK